MDLKNLKEFKEYTRIKKIDVRKWLLRGHAPLYTFILIVFAAAVVFMFSTIHSMFNNENTRTIHRMKFPFLQKQPVILPITSPICLRLINQRII